MADDNPVQDDQEDLETISSYLGLSFGLFLALLPTNSISLVQKQQTQIKQLTLRLLEADEQLRQMKLRRKEDSKANARVVEIFASHRNARQAEEKRLLKQIDAAAEDMASLRAKMQDLEAERAEWKARIQDLEREVSEREEMIEFMSRNAVSVDDNNDYGLSGDNDVEVKNHVSGGYGNGECWGDGDEDSVNFVYGQHIGGGGCSSDLLAAASKFWAEKASLWQDVQYESLQPHYHMKHFVARRESPWKVDGESTGISSKLTILEQELLNLENIDKTDPSKVPSLMRKQAKRYQALAGKIDDLCHRMQASDPCEPTLSSEFRTQRQTEFLLEAFRLQQRASETGQKLMTLQTEIGKTYFGDEVGSPAKLTTKRSFDLIRNNLKEVQRNLEIWLARIIGDLEGILARDGASRAREYYVSRYPFVQ